VVLPPVDADLSLKRMRELNWCAGILLKELVCRHIAEGTTDKILLLQCQFVSVGLVLADCVRDRGVANGGQIQQ
jgi:hypothetical protein